MIKLTYTHEELEEMDFKIPHNLPYRVGKGTGSNYSDIIMVTFQEILLLEEGFDYVVDKDSISFHRDRFYDAIPKQTIYNFEVEIYVDLSLFMKIYTCNENQLALFLTSSDYKERALAEIRYREIENNKKYTEKLKEVLGENNKEGS